MYGVQDTVMRCWEYGRWYELLMLYRIVVVSSISYFTLLYLTLLSIRLFLIHSSFFLSFFFLVFLQYGTDVVGI